MKLAILCVISFAAATHALLSPDFTEHFMLFAWDESVEENPNIVVSPFSLLPPLGAFVLGSQGSTSNEILHALDLRDLNEVVKQYTDGKRILQELDRVQVKIANRVYIAEDSVVNRYFNHASQGYFDLEVVDLNFGCAENAANEINYWVRNKTANRINNVIDASALSRATRSVFVNTVYFEGKWQAEFRPVRNEVFYLSDKSTMLIDAMYITAYVPHTHSAYLDSQLFGVAHILARAALITAVIRMEHPKDVLDLLIAIPYEDPQCSFLVVLPYITSNLRELRLKIAGNPFAINEELMNLKSTFAEFTMPKFQFELKTDLKKVLQRMNMKNMFSSESDLNNVLVRETLFIGAAFQKAFIKVNEKGTIASAANVFATFRSSGGPSPPQINVNRPFYFEIRCSNMVLFNGVVNKPHS